MSRRRLAVVLGVLATIGPLSIDAVLPAFPAIARALGASVPSVQLTLAAYLAGILSGQLVHGPLSDRLGRRPPLLAGLGLYVAAAVAAALASTLPALAAARFVQGLGACAVIVVSRAVVRDRCGDRDAAALYSSRMLVAGAAPILAPALGGQLVASFGWRGVFVALAAAGVALLALVARALPESLAPARARAPGVRETLRDAAAALRDRRFVRLSLAGGASEAALFAFLAGAPFVFIEHFGVSPARFGLVTAANAAAIVAVSQLNRRLVRRVGVGRVLRAGTSAAVLAFAAVAVAVRAGAGLAVAAAMIAGVATLGVVLPNATAAAMDGRAERAGSASAVLGVLQSASGAAATSAVSLLADGTPGPMSLVMLACGVAALALVRAERDPGRARCAPPRQEPSVLRRLPGAGATPHHTGENA